MNKLTYDSAEFISTVESFKVQVQVKVTNGKKFEQLTLLLRNRHGSGLGMILQNFLRLWFTNVCNKLERLPLESLFSLV